MQILNPGATFDLSLAAADGVPKFRLSRLGRYSGAAGRGSGGYAQSCRWSEFMDSIDI